MREKIERRLIPLIAQLVDYLQKKLITYKHQQIKSRLKFCGRGVRFKGDLRIDHPQNVSIGDKVYIGYDTVLDGRGGIEIGTNTTLGFNVVILSANHDITTNALPYEHNVYIHKRVVIGRNVWIAANVLIVPGVTIGDGAIIAAGTVVTSNVEPLAIVGNQPMRTIRYRDKEHYDRLDKQELEKETERSDTVAAEESL